MQQQVTISMQYQAWLDMIDRLEQIITKIESGTEVTDPGAVSELEQIRGILSSPLTVQDSAAQTELTAIKNALSGVLNMKASDTDAELSLIKEKLEDIETKLNGTLTTQLTGSIAEYGWAHNQPEPTPAESFAFGVRIESDGTMTSMYWNGSEWNEVA